MLQADYQERRALHFLQNLKDFNETHLSPQFVLMNQPVSPKMLSNRASRVCDHLNGKKYEHKLNISNCESRMVNLEMLHHL